MRPLWKDMLIAIWIGIIIPGIVLNAFALFERRRIEPQVQAAPIETVYNDSKNVTIRTQGNLLVNMELDDYLTGVLIAEMPAEFHLEALKAQSVAARTYAWKAHTTGGKHGDGSLCTDSVCCQGFLTKEDYISRGGTEEHWDKIRRAVHATSGFAMTYGGELIEATYFSSSGGNTESALAVWGMDIPYLQSVPSPEDAFINVQIYHKSDLEDLLGCSFSNDPTQWFGSVSYTDGGGVEYMEIGGKCYTGMELRSMLGLRSTVFWVESEEDKIKITTRGYGHRVGMSQYGANAMAETGSTWQGILQHYYPGILVNPIF